MGKGMKLALIAIGVTVVGIAINVALNLE